MSGKKLSFGFATILLAGWMGAQAAEYQIDPAHSGILFKVTHMGINTVTGRFDSFQAVFDVDPNNIEATKGSAVIDVKSINTSNAKRDNHLRSDDFFNAEKFPEIRFTSTSVRNVNKGDSTCDLIGNLTLRDVTKEIVLHIKGGGIIRDDWGNEHAAFKATGRINRFDYNLKWNKLMEAGGLVVGPDVDLALTFEGVRPAEAVKK